MPWQTPPLRDVRAAVRDYIRGSLPGADASIPNSVLRVMSDVQGATCHLTLQYLDWLALQLMPDTAEQEWLDRFGNIWLVNSDGTTGRKLATLAQGQVTLTGGTGIIAPQAMQLSRGVGGGETVLYETLVQATVSGSADVAVRAIDNGSIGNADAGDILQVINPPPGLDAGATVIVMEGGTDDETDDELRARVLRRIRNPPMGGDTADYIAWALAVPGVTRAWANVEQGIGTMTVRFMMDDLRAANDGFPEPDDVNTVAAYIDKMRPVTVKDCFTCAPIKQFIDVNIGNLVPDTDECKAEIEQQLQQMIFNMAAPGQTIFAAWINYAIMGAASVISYQLQNDNDQPMDSLGNMAVLGTISYF
jgi:uncharacterized phage protein gp47/JayE